jgi:sec-independent protein translocase protein TatA
MRIQFWHIIVLLLVVLLLFGSSKLPDLARSVGKSMKIFKNEVRELRDDSPPASSTEPPTPLPPTGAPPVGSMNSPMAWHTPDTPGEEQQHRDPAGGDPGPRDR